VKNLLRVGVEIDTKFHGVQQKNSLVIVLIARMFGMYEANERGLVKGPIEIEQSSNRRNIGLIRINLMIKYIM